MHARAMFINRITLDWARSNAVCLNCTTAACSTRGIKLQLFAENKSHHLKEIFVQPSLPEMIDNTLDFVK